MVGVKRKVNGDATGIPKKAKFENGVLQRTEKVHAKAANIETTAKVAVSKSSFAGSGTSADEHEMDVEEADGLLENVSLATTKNGLTSTPAEPTSNGICHH